MRPLYRVIYHRQDDHVSNTSELRFCSSALLEHGQNLFKSLVFHITKTSRTILNFSTPRKGLHYMRIV